MNHHQEVAHRVPVQIPQVDQVEVPVVARRSSTILGSDDHERFGIDRYGGLQVSPMNISFLSLVRKPGLIVF